MLNLSQCMRHFSLMFIAITLCSLSTSLHASVILSENFDELTPELSATLVGSFSTIGGTNGDIVGNVNGNLFSTLCAAPESGNCVDMNGSFGNPQSQLQSNMLFSTGSYLLSFDLIGSQRGPTASVTVTLGDYNQTFNLASSDVTTGIVVNAPVTVTAPSPLLFASNTSGNIGLLLDNVVVSQTSPSVPEPATLSIFSLGLAGMSLVRRRRLA